MSQLLNVGPRRSQPSQRREPRKIITVCIKEDVHLKKSENAWKPSLKRETQVEDPENIKTQVGRAERRRGVALQLAPIKRRGHQCQADHSLFRLVFF